MIKLGDWVRGWLRDSWMQYYPFEGEVQHIEDNEVDIVGHEGEEQCFPIDELEVLRCA